MLRSRTQKYNKHRCGSELEHRSESGLEPMSGSMSGHWSWFGSEFKSGYESMSGYFLLSGSGKKSWSFNKIYISGHITNITILLELSKDEDKEIRINIANNVNVSKEILDILSKDKDEEVMQAARLAKIKCLL